MKSRDTVSVVVKHVSGDITLDHAVVACYIDILLLMLGCKAMFFQCSTHCPEMRNNSPIFWDMRWNDSCEYLLL